MKRIYSTGLWVWFAAIGWSDVIVKYSPLSESAAPPLRAVTSSDAASKVWNFSDSIPLFDGSAAAGTSIYGGLQASVTVGPIVCNPAILMTDGRFTAQTTGGPGYVGAIKGILLWDQADYLVGSDLKVEFDAGSSLNMTLFRNDGTAQWVIRNDGTYYISDVTVPGMGSASLSGADSVQWAAWDPTANGGADFADVPLSGYAGRAFTNVTAVGVYFSVQRGVGLNVRFTLSDNAGGGFTADLRPVYQATTALAEGAWSSNSIWSGNVVPTAADDVNLPNPGIVTINSEAGCKSLSMGSRTGVSQLWLQSGSLAAEVYMSMDGSPSSSDLRISGGVLNVPVLHLGKCGSDALTSTRVEFSGGTVNVSEMTLSSLNGTVELAVTGSAADIHIGAFEATAGANQPYRLRFTPDAEGISPLHIAGSANIGTNRVSVVVDFSGYAGQTQSMALVTSGNLVGCFADIRVENLTPYLTADFSTSAEGLVVHLTRNGPELAIAEDGVPMDVEMAFGDPHWLLHWPTIRHKRYAVQVSRDGLKTWENHGEAIIGTGWTHYSYVPMETMGDNGFARVVVSDRTGETQADRQPNILMLIVDDMNDWPGFNGGHSFTPNLDALAARGMSFSNAHIPTTYCTPSRTAFMTGKHPASTGFYGNNVYFYSRPDLESLPAYFKRAGYNTFGAGKVFHHMPGYTELDAYTQFYHWNPNEKLAGWPYNAWSEDNLARPSDPVMLEERFGAIPNDREPYMADSLTADYAIGKLQEAHDEPFFMTIGTYAPHLERFAPQKYFDLYPSNSFYMPEIHLDDLGDLDPSLRANRLPKTESGAIDYELLAREIQAYHACVTFADAQHGRILDALAASPYATNTIVVFWSDNGYHMGEKLRTGKHTIWERTSSVPFVWAGPGIPQNIQYHHVVGTLDSYPTLVEMAGLPQKNGLDGASLVPVFQNPTQDYGRVEVQVAANGADFAVITDDWRYIDRKEGLDELYDWRADAPAGPDTDELNNLINDPAYASVVADLSAHVPANPANSSAVSGNSPGDLRLITSKKIPALGERYYWETIP